MKTTRFWKAAPHAWGPGKAHRLVDENQSKRSAEDSPRPNDNSTGRSRVRRAENQITLGAAEASAPQMREQFYEKNKNTS